MLTFCTLFDSNYLDKGLVLYRSMEKVMPEFKVYILAMDDKCYTILNAMDLAKARIISLQEFEDEEMIELKKQRSRAEYCWTCTASLIDYVFENYQESYCTYIDSDLFFYKNPKVLIDEMNEAGCSVQIVEHGFGTGRRADRQVRNSGRFCVQFNTFKNDVYGREVLSVWKGQCRAHCSMGTNEMGDQKYLSDWPEKYEKVHVLEHQGGGVAPWNIIRYRNARGRKGYLTDKKTKNEFELIFYHFHQLEYMEDGFVNINAFKHGFGMDKKMIYEIYIPYLKRIEETKKELSEKYGFSPMIKSHPGFVKKTKEEKKEAVKNMGFMELLERVEEKIIYLQGKKKDIIDLKKL